MAAAATVRIQGLREVNRAFKRIDAQLAKEVKDELKKSAEPVAADAREHIGHYVGASTSTIQPIALMGGVFVRQRQRKRGGNRPDFGALQMRILLGAAFDHEDEIYRNVEHMLDWLARKEGF